jgi:broad specificity phosphatase PhoE
MDEIALARHGESETGARGLVGGDTGLTPRGRRQAHALAGELAPTTIDVCVTSSARRARHTAQIVLADRDVPIEVDPDFGEVAFGIFEGRPLDEYRTWIETHPPDASPPGGESRVGTLRRFARAFRGVLARRARLVLIVAHGLTLAAVVEPRPRPIVSGVPYGTLVRLGRDELEDAVSRLERWCNAPAW